MSYRVTLCGHEKVAVYRRKGPGKGKHGWIQDMDTRQGDVRFGLTRVGEAAVQLQKTVSEVCPDQSGSKGRGGQGGSQRQSSVLESNLASNNKRTTPSGGNADVEVEIKDRPVGWVLPTTVPTTVPTGSWNNGPTTTATGIAIASSTPNICANECFQR